MLSLWVRFLVQYSLLLQYGILEKLVTYFVVWIARFGARTQPFLRSAMFYLIQTPRAFYPELPAILTWSCFVTIIGGMPEESDVPNENLYEQLKDQVSSLVQALIILLFLICPIIQMSFQTCINCEL